MTLTEKIDQLQVAANAPTLICFANIVGVNKVTLDRIKASNYATDRILSRIAETFRDITTEMLRNNDLSLPSNIQLSKTNLLERQRNQEQGSIIHEGKQLLHYLRRTGTKQSELADGLGVSRVQVHSYTKTERFRPDVKGTILAALGVSKQVVFVDRPLSRSEPPHPVPGGNLRGLLLIKSSERAIDSNTLPMKIEMFDPEVEPDRAYLVCTGQLTKLSVDLKHTLTIQVAKNDQMEPLLQPDAIVLAQQIEPAKWPDVAGGSVAILINSNLVIRQMYRNDLRTNNLLEIGAYDRSRGNVISLRRKDIQALFQITHILFSPL